MKNKFKNIIVQPVKSVTFTQRELAQIARYFKPGSELRCQGALKQFLAPDQFAECWRIRKLQITRAANSWRDPQPEPLGNWERRGLKKKAWKNTRKWRPARTMHCDYLEHLAAPVQKSWRYRSRVKYSVSLHHSRTEVKYSSSRPACSYDTLSVTLTWDLLLHRWQWIGGMLTISRKTDAGKRAYPCWWFQQVKGGVGLETKQGWIINGQYHVSAVGSEADARKKKASIIRRAKEAAERWRRETEERQMQRQAEIMARTVNAYPAPKGWVNRFTSLAAGNCEGGTDNFIQARVVPFLKSLSKAPTERIFLGDLRGISIPVKTLLQIERSPQTRRVCQFANK